MSNPSTTGELQRFCTFTVAGQLYGLAVEHVQEVLRSHVATRMPLVPATIGGLINLRGDIVMTFDLRRRLGITPGDDGDPTARPMHVVVRTHDGVTSVLVDEVRDVIELHRSSIEAVPANTEPRFRDVCAGIFQLEGQVLVVLDLDRLFDPDALNERANSSAAPAAIDQQQGAHT